MTSPTPSKVRRWSRRVLVAFLVVGVLALGYAWNRGWLERSFIRANVPCGDQDWTPAPPVPDDRGLDLALEPIDAAFGSATSISFHPSEDVAYVTEQTGQVTVVRDGVADPQPALEIDVALDTDQGLFSGAVDPDGDWLYLAATQLDGSSILDAFPITADGSLVDERVRLQLVEQPTVLHAGGALAFLPDGTLLHTLGDGGKVGDRDDNGQRPETLLGSILRIEPTPEGERPYEIPDDNPYANADPGEAAPEVWAIGLRNAFRISVDPVGDRVWVTDVGHNCYEEVQSVPIDNDGIAPNFGWNRFEGTRVFLGGEPDDYVPPIVALPHAASDTCAVIGGAVARGDAAPSLEGEYVFADLCSAIVYAIDADDPTPELRTLDVAPPGVFGIMSDPDGDLWIVSPSQVARLVENGSADGG